MSEIDCRELWNDIEQLREKRNLFQEQIESADANGAEDADGRLFRKNEADAEAYSDQLLEKYRKELYELHPDASIKIERMPGIEGRDAVLLEDGRLAINSRWRKVITILEPDGDGFIKKDSLKAANEARIESLPGGAFLAISLNKDKPFRRIPFRDISIFKREGDSYKSKEIVHMADIVEVTKVSGYHFIIKNSEGVYSVAKIEDDIIVAESFGGLRSALPLPDGSIVGTAKDDEGKSVIMHYKPKQEGQYKDCEKEQIGEGDVEKVLPNGDLIVSNGNKLFLCYRVGDKYIRQEQSFREMKGGVSFETIYALKNGNIIVCCHDSGKEPYLCLYRRKGDALVQEKGFSRRDDYKMSFDTIQGQFAAELSDGTLIIKEKYGLEAHHPMSDGKYRSEGVCFRIENIMDRHITDIGSGRQIIANGIGADGFMLLSRDFSIENLKQNIDDFTGQSAD